MLDLILESGFIGILIVVLFFLALVIVLERWWVFRRASTDLNAFSKEFEAALAKGDFTLSQQICDKKEYRGTIPGVYKLAIVHREKGPATVRNILYNHIDHTEIPRLKARLNLLSSVGKTAPMLGLIGTVWGMIGAFATIAGTEGQGVDPKQLGGDIGLALGTTFLGLLVAIPVVFALTFLRARVEQFEIDLDQYSQKCLDLIFPSQRTTLHRN